MPLLLSARHPSPLAFPYTTLFRSPVCRPGCPPDGPSECLRPSECWGPEIPGPGTPMDANRSEEHTSELQSLRHLVCRLLLEKKKKRQGAHVSVSTTKPVDLGHGAV